MKGRAMDTLIEVRNLEVGFPVTKRKFLTSTTQTLPRGGWCQLRHSPGRNRGACGRIRVGQNHRGPRHIARHRPDRGAR